MNNLQVMIVDDERLSRRRLKRLLAQDTGLTVIAECPTADEALTRLRHSSVDIVFLDVQMPGMDGFTFLDAPGRTVAGVQFW